jgi:hypothetical protein
LIDAAKDAAKLFDAYAAEAEGVALLTDDGAVHSGAGGRVGVATEAEGVGTGITGSPLSAAQAALEQVRGCGDREILAAAVAAPHDPSLTVLPSTGSYMCLAELDPELPLVLKQYGRWVVLPLSRVRSVS